MAPRVILKCSVFMWAIRFSWVSHSSRRKSRSSSSILWQQSQRLHPFSFLMETDSEAIVCDNSIRFSEMTFIRVTTRTIAKALLSFNPALAGRVLILRSLLRYHDVHFIPRQLAARWLIEYAHRNVIARSLPIEKGETGVWISSLITMI